MEEGREFCGMARHARHQSDTAAKHSNLTRPELSIGLIVWTLRQPKIAISFRQICRYKYYLSLVQRPFLPPSVFDLYYLTMSISRSPLRESDLRDDSVCFKSSGCNGTEFLLAPRNLCDKGVAHRRASHGLKMTSFQH